MRSWRRACAGSMPSPATIASPNWSGRAMAPSSSTSIRLKISAGLSIGWHQLDDVAVDQQLAGILEIDRDAVLDDRLDLPEAPVRPLGMADEIARCEHRVAAVLRHGTGSIFREGPRGSDSHGVRASWP